MTFYCSACGSPLPSEPPVVCPFCGTAHWQDAKPCASALITHDGRLLLVQRAHHPWHGYWDVPGGFCEFNEHPILTAEREAREETGLTVQVTGFLGIWLDDYQPKDASESKKTLNIYFHAVPLEGSRTRPDPAEVSHIRWFDPDELPSDLAFPNHLKPALSAWRGAFRAAATVTPLVERLTAGNGKNMGKAETRDDDLDLRPYYDFSGGVRGRYVGRFAGSCTVVELEPDVAEVFPDAASVNRTLREVIAARGAKLGGR